MPVDPLGSPRCVGLGSRNLPAGRIVRSAHGTMSVTQRENGAVDSDQGLSALAN